MPISRIETNSIASSQTLTTPIIATTMGVGGATPAGSGSGITFPAAQSASTDANTLDDYEEGTWTPTLSSGTAVIGSATGTYTKIGNRVICSFNFICTTAGTSNNIGGLPFTSASGPETVNAAAAREYYNTGYLWCAQQISGGTQCYFRRYDNNINISLNDRFSGTIVYNV